MTTASSKLDPDGNPGTRLYILNDLECQFRKARRVRASHAQCFIICLPF